MIARLLRLFPALAFLLALSAPRPAHAMLLPEYDLASLVAQSTAIVRAQKVSSRKPDEYTTMVKYRVLKVYEGPLAVGDTIELADDYARAPVWGWDDNKPHVVSDEVIAFLARPHNKDSGREWDIVLSGLRVCIDGKVYRFHQAMNPGGYEPVPQGRDPWDLMGDPRGASALEWASFDGELTRAMDRRARIKKALEGELGTEAGKKALLDTMPPLEDEDAPTIAGQEVSFYHDEMAVQVVSALAKTGDLTATLEALSRSRGRGTLDNGMSSIPSPALIEFAASAKNRLVLRRTALWVLRERAFGLDDLAWKSLIPLQSDPEVEIRKATIHLASPPGNKRFREALLQRFAVETDPAAKGLIARAAVRMELMNELSAAGASWPVSFPERDNQMIVVTMLHRSNPAPRVEKLTLTATRSGEPPRTLVAGPKEMGSGASANEAQAYLRLVFDPPLTPGTYALELLAIIDDDGKSIPHKWSLAPLKVRPAPPPPPAMASPSTSSSPAPARTSSSGAAPSPASGGAPKSSCACRIAGNGAPHPGAGFQDFSAIALAVGLVVRRRRGRRPAVPAQ